MSPEGGILPDNRINIAGSDKAKESDEIAVWQRIRGKVAFQP